jgi:tRNA nucleotidyltransferase/poly(A) polymerase
VTEAALTGLDWALIRRIRAALPPGQPLYLVGGAVRDALLGRPVHDLDFVVLKHARKAARRAADVLGAAYYPLDEARDTGRVILPGEAGRRAGLDFAVARGGSLPADLAGRDFTVNAIAIDLSEPDRLIDPLGGLSDLRQGWLRPCSPQAFEADPVRVIRAARQALAFRLRLAPETAGLIRRAAPQLGRVSGERLRDELFRLLDAPNAAAGLRMLDTLGILPELLPEAAQLKGLRQSPPHTLDVFEHSLAVVARLEQVLAVLLPGQPAQAAGEDLASGWLALRLGQFRPHFSAHFGQRLNPERSLPGLLKFTALYHDAGKAQRAAEDGDGRVRFLGHEQVSGELLETRGRALRLSNEELSRAGQTARDHMRPLFLAAPGAAHSRRAVYRYFRQLGEVGVDIAVLSLADVWGTYGVGLPEAVWMEHVDRVRLLLEAWWVEPAESLLPEPLLNGHDLMQSFHLKPGRQIGRLLEELREAQALGEAATQEEALAWLTRRLAFEAPEDGAAPQG